MRLLLLEWPPGNMAVAPPHNGGQRDWERSRCGLCGRRSAGRRTV